MHWGPVSPHYSLVPFGSAGVSSTDGRWKAEVVLYSISPFFLGGFFFWHDLKEGMNVARMLKDVLTG
jgi:hypothetical protein